MLRSQDDFESPLHSWAADGVADSDDQVIASNSAAMDLSAKEYSDFICFKPFGGGDSNSPSSMTIRKPYASGITDYLAKALKQSVH